MSKASSKKTTEPDEAPSFEKALKRLEEVVEMLDEGNLPLARSIELFKEGTELAKSCRAMLAQADVQIKEALGHLADADDEDDDEPLSK